MPRTVRLDAPREQRYQLNHGSFPTGTLSAGPYRVPEPKETAVPHAINRYKSDLRELQFVLFEQFG